MEEGLPSNGIHCLLQDRVGYLWIGTENGLCRFDGQKFSRPLGNDVTAGVYSLIEEEDHLWVGTDKGLFIYSQKTDSLIPSDLTLYDGTPIRCQVPWMGLDQNQTLWIATMGQGICSRVSHQNTLHQYLLPDGNGLVASMLIDNNNQIWTITNWSNQPCIACYNPGNHAFEPFELHDDNGNTVSPQGLVMHQDPHGRIWIGTWTDGLMSFDPHTRLLTHNLAFEGNHLRHIHSLMQYDEHRMMIGSDEGMTLYDTQSGEMQFFGNDELDPTSLSNQFVYPIMRDREGGLWVGTYYGGIDYANPRTGIFSSYLPSKFHNSVGGQIISRLCEDRQGNLWIASDDGGLSCYHPATNQFESVPLHEPGKPVHNAHALCLYKEELWVGTYTSGIDIVNLRTKAVRHYPYILDIYDNVLSSSCYALFRDSHDRLWAGTFDAICQYDPSTDRFVKKHDLGEMTIDIQEDLAGNLWFATTGNGLWRFSPTTGQWRQFKAAKEFKARNVVSSLEVDANGLVWAGTMEGLLCYNPEQEVFNKVDLIKDLIDIKSLVFDGKQLWIGTPMGLIRYTPNGSEGLQVFTRGDGLSNACFMPAAAFRSSDGRVYMGTARGMNAFYPNQVPINSTAPTIVFTELEIYNRAVPVGSESLPTNLNNLDRLELNYDENVFSVSFAALSFFEPEKNQYAYWLEGFDPKEQWVEVGNQTKAVYTNLSPGEYVLHVRGTNNDALWCTDEASLRIVIHPPFYWHPVAKLIYLFIAVLSIFLLVRYFVHRKEKEHRQRILQMEQENAQNIQEARIRFFTTIAHEIRTPVSLISAPLEKIRKTKVQLPATISDDLDIIGRNSHRLLQLVNQLLDFRKMEDGSVFYSFQPTAIQTLVDDVSKSFEPSMKERGIRFSIVGVTPDFRPCVDREAITKLISNLLSNALKYTTDEIRLSISQQTADHQFSITVTDNGQGISSNEKEQIFRPFYQANENKPGTGIGLSIVKGIVEAHQGEISIESVPGEHTSFIVTLPDNLKADTPTLTECTPDVQDNPAPHPCVVNEEKGTLLLVDDNEEMLHFLSQSLRDEYNIVTATNGQLALKVLETEAVNMIISDWMMPVMDGEKLCQEIRKNTLTSHIPFIMLTAKTDDNSKVQGMDCGADLYVEKPFSLDYLQACIRNLLRMRLLLAQKFQREPFEPIESLASTPADEDFLTKLEKVIEKNISNQDLSVDFLCREFAMSRTAFFAKIRSLADVSPNQMIQLIRLRHAAVLLQQKQQPVSEVCYMVGFSSPSYFSKCFQKQFGTTPTEFMKT